MPPKDRAWEARKKGLEAAEHFQNKQKTVPSGTVL